MRAAPDFATATGDDRWRLPPYTADQVRSLPATVGFADVARAFGLSKDGAEAAVAAEKFPVRPIMLGSRIRRFLRSELLAALGIPEIPSSSQSDSARHGDVDALMSTLTALESALSAAKGALQDIRADLSHAR